MIDLARSVKQKIFNHICQIVIGLTGSDGPPWKGWKTRNIKTSCNFSISAMDKRMRQYRPSSSAKGVSSLGLDCPKIIFNLSGGQWQWELTYFVTVDANINWPEEFFTSHQISSELGHDTGRCALEG